MSQRLMFVRNSKRCRAPLSGTVARRVASDRAWALPDKINGETVKNDYAERHRRWKGFLYILFQTHNFAKTNNVCINITKTKEASTYRLKSCNVIKKFYLIYTRMFWIFHNDYQYYRISITNIMPYNIISL